MTNILVLQPMTVWSGVAGLQVNIPQEQYEYARGDNITLPCSFKSSQANPKQITITWSSEGQEANAEEVSMFVCLSGTGTT